MTAVSAVEGGVGISRSAVRTFGGQGFPPVEQLNVVGVSRIMIASLHLAAQGVGEVSSHWVIRCQADGCELLSGQHMRRD